MAAPGFEEFATETGLHHAGCGHDDAWTDVLKVVDALEVADVLEDEGIVDGNLPLDATVHGADVRLVDGHALLGERGGVVDGNVVKFGVLRPVFVQDEQEFLGSAEGKDGDEATAAASDRVVDDAW